MKHEWEVIAEGDTWSEAITVETSWEDPRTAATEAAYVFLDDHDGQEWMSNVATNVFVRKKGEETTHKLSVFVDYEPAIHATVLE